MAITTALCTSWKTEVLQGLHNFTASTGNTFKIALYTSSATLGASTTIYTTSNEVVGTGYSAGGLGLTSVTPVLVNNIACCDFFPDPLWTTSTITARGALVYNSTNGNRAVGSYDFGSDKVSTAGDFTVVFPIADDTRAVVRIA
jgi:hypothetical protein